MSHKKTNSGIHVPFSWEKIPGVPKYMASPRRTLVRELSRKSLELQRKKTLPLPPGSFQQPLKVVSKRMFSSEEDPFIAAMIQCTKDSDHNDKDSHEMKKSFGSRVWTNKSFLSTCKHSFEVQECHLSTRPSSFVVRGLYHTQLRRRN